jgi:DNA-binding response OmpR family regulator
MARILIIDDEPEILTLFQLLLEDAGYEVHTCQSGRLAWDAIVKSRPDMVILDVMLPGVDGHSIQMRMAQESETKAIPVLIMTALGPTQTLFAGAPNVVGFLLKPFRAEDILSIVKSSLKSA